jgi:hypothetical protein
MTTPALPRQTDFCVSIVNSLLLRDFPVLIYPYQDQDHSGAFEMKRFILATATTIALSGLGIANGGSTGAVGNPQDAGQGFRLAMGPTSAAHVPGGSADGPRETSSTCAPSCPRHHKRAKHRH